MKYHYPNAPGGLPAPLGCRLIILTHGGADIMGWWHDGADFLAWCYPPERDQDAEDRIRAGEIERVMGILAES